jgi:hypothetical protein
LGPQAKTLLHLGVMLRNATHCGTSCRVVVRAHSATRRRSIRRVDWPLQTGCGRSLREGEWLRPPEPAVHLPPRCMTAVPWKLTPVPFTRPVVALPIGWTATSALCGRQVSAPDPSATFAALRWSARISCSRWCHDIKPKPGWLQPAREKKPQALCAYSRCARATGTVGCFGAVGAA